MDQSSEYDKEAFLKFLNELRDTMVERGFTQEALDEILTDEK
jgi:hypothetical protein